MMTLKIFCRMSVIGLLVGVGATTQAQANQKLLDQLDAASKRFQNASADVAYDNYTRVVRSDEIEMGHMFIERAGTSETMGLVLTDQGEKSPSLIVNYDGGAVHRYTPGTNQDDVFKAGANQAKIDSFLTLGFGGSGKDLARAWNITDQGAEVIDGVKCEKLDLLSKDQGVKNMYSHVTIWVDPTRGVSLKQMSFAPNGDTHTALYTNIKLNGRIDKKPYAIPAKATKIQH